MTRKLKKIGAALLSAAMAAVLSGCMYVGVKTELRDNGTAALTAKFGILKEYYTDDAFDKEDAEIKSYTVNGKEYMGYEETSEYASYAELAADMETLSEDGTSLFKNVDAEMKAGLFVNKYSFTATVANLMGGDDSAEDDEYSDMASSMLTFDFSLKMPGSVKNYEGGVLNPDGSITFNVNPNAECICSAESTSLNFVGIFGTIAAVIILIAVLLLRKKKN